MSRANYLGINGDNRPYAKGRRDVRHVPQAVFESVTACGMIVLTCLNVLALELD